MRFDRFNKLVNLETKNYLRYAIGEVVLVVAGILIALQVNNWNELKKQEKEEKKILLSLHNEISSSILNCELVIKKRREVLNAGEEILKYTSPNGIWKSQYKLDSLIFHITNSGWRHVPQEGVLNEIINSGKLSLISENKLRTQISSLPRAYSQMIENDRINRLNITVNIVPLFYSKSILKNVTNYIEPFKFSKTPLGYTKFKASYNLLLRDPEIEDALSYQNTYKKYGVEFLEKVRLKYFEIQELIEAKYPNVDYVKLDKDLDRGVWN